MQPDASVPAIVSPLSRTARLRRRLGRGRAALRAGDLAGAQRRAEQVRCALPAPGERSPVAGDVAVSCLQLLGDIRRDRDDLDGAVRLHRQSLRIAPDDDRRARCLAQLRVGDCLRLQAQYADSERELRAAVDLARRCEPPDPMLTAATLNALGILCKDIRRFHDAARHYGEALALLRSALGADHPRLAFVFHNLAGLEHAQGRYAAAEPLARHAIALRERGDGPTSPGAAGDLAVLGAVLLGLGRLSEAEVALNRSRRLWTSLRGVDHYEMAVVLSNLGSVLDARGDHDAARSHWRQARRIKQRVLGDRHPEVVALRHTVRSDRTDGSTSAGAVAVGRAT
ncbi:tetratricopeptide repeat protein [Microlunatus ginsengisoli]|uniref:Tetratricopeptide repeat protein n=1 Tax=Microlunatus ginsengisoli TaxID=363863 RepID=A0ABP7ASV0_9ACTN